MICGEKFSGTVMAPIPYPAYGWEPVQDSDKCEREQGHSGKHQGKRIEWDAEPAPASGQERIPTPGPFVDEVEESWASNQESKP